MRSGSDGGRIVQHEPAGTGGSVGAEAQNTELGALMRSGSGRASCSPSRPWR
jgi:hypothetical protein